MAFAYDAGDKPTVAVIGGGIVGILVALKFQRSGYKVIVVDRGSKEARCSFGNAGSLSPGSVAPLGMPGVIAKVPSMLFAPAAPLKIQPRYAVQALPWLMRFVFASSQRRVQRISHALSGLLSDSIELYTAILRSINAQDIIQRRGQLQLYPSVDARRTDASVWQLRRDRGVTVEEISREEIRQLEPSIGPRYACGIYLPNEGMVTDPARLVDVLTEHFVADGGTLIEEGVEGFGGEGKRASHLRTSGERVVADSYVVAAGAWSRELARQAGDDVPLVTQRGYHITLPHAGIALSRPVVAADRKYFVSPMEMGIRVAGTVEFDSLDAPPDDRRVKALADAVPELLPGIDVGGASSWMGHRPCMPDSLPVIDRSQRFANVFYAFGNGHLGLTGAPKMAELVVAMATDRTPGMDLRPFRASRFELLHRTGPRSEEGRSLERA
ncbi:FAD-dependent oxidoreductase [Methylobacterium sp. NEAU 140]|uniref:NAD(P)/FAD-dependent oxidoreductase n=1 Tax=Methylobacterium sp. NEAU 140 TaxID=3064945 RepID=UPI002735F8C6|nr:FAD-dependent oxidoreductase [Methylobacterium sp. NEAU 140]MDP4026591.1 FAD-dependent oxidoreductase [Methylobacterium sp. NEAU 140]